MNRLLAEGRSRFRDLISRSEDGTRCRELRPLLSAFCDGEAGPDDAGAVREHLRACAHCRATMRTYRAAPGLASALIPAAVPSRWLLGRLRDLLARAGSQISGAAKVVAVCAAGTVGCVATGVVSLPHPSQAPPSKPPVGRVVDESNVAPKATKPKPLAQRHERRNHPPRRISEGNESTVETEASPEPVEYEPPSSPPVESESSARESESSDSAAGEFGP